jgi:signal transduction histidine kinase
MIRRLRPVGLDDLGLEAALEHCVDSWRERLPGTRFHLEVPGDLPDLGEHFNMSAYRIVQEALTNIAKHAGASDVRVVLHIDHSWAGRSLHIEVHDNGEGSNLDAPTPGLGLIGMRERVQALGGDFRVQSVLGHGFVVIASLPLQDDEPGIDNEVRVA